MMTDTITTINMDYIVQCLNSSHDIPPEQFPNYCEFSKFNSVQLFLRENCADIPASVYTYRENALFARVFWPMRRSSGFFATLRMTDPVSTAVVLNRPLEAGAEAVGAEEFFAEFGLF